MREDQMMDLADCTEFRQTLLVRPPRIVHGTVILLVLLLGTALVWSAVTTADLVVRAPGYVRPVTTPIKVLVPAHGEVLSASFGGRVVEVKVRPGDEVRQGDLLLRLDTEQLDIEIVKRHHTIQAGEEERRQLEEQEKLLARQFEEATAKAEAEWAREAQEVRLAQARRTSDIHLFQSDLRDAETKRALTQRLAASGAAPSDQLRDDEAKLRKAWADLEKARLPVNEEKLKVLRLERVLVEKDYALKRKELEMKRGAKHAEVEAARKDLDNLERERNQALIRAPLTGIVTTGDVKVGAVVKPGDLVMEIAEQQGFRFELQVPSEEIGQLGVGMPARIRLDAYDYQRYGTLDGTVCFVSPDSSLGEGQRAASYLVRIDVARDEVGRGVFRGRVKLGMAGQAEIVTDHESLLLLLVKRIRHTLSLG
jgi:multidrug resistance efflux pump